MFSNCFMTEMDASQCVHVAGIDCSGMFPVNVEVHLCCIVSYLTLVFF